MGLARQVRRNLVAGGAVLVLGLTATVVAVAEPEPATGTILNAGAADAVPGSYLVTLKDNQADLLRGNPATLLLDQVSGLVGTYGGVVGRTYSSVMRGF